VKQIARDVARMLVILPFEAAFYARHGVRATYVGNPVADEASAAVDRGALRRSLGLREDGRVLALLPGSRAQEIRRLYRPMLKAAAALARDAPGLEIVVPVAPTVARELLERQADGVDGSLANARIAYVAGRARDALAAADAAIVASGTATLEAALAGTPLVVVYRVNWISWLLGKLLVRVPYVALVNLLAGRRVVPELLQGGCTSEAMVREFAPLLSSGPRREEQIEGMRRVRADLLAAGAPGAARRAAEELASMLRDAR
jgi:lipid-A-disaccharide synthase